MNGSVPLSVRLLSSLVILVHVWYTSASALLGWVLCRELTKLTRPDLHHVTHGFICKDAICLSTWRLSHLFDNVSVIVHTLYIHVYHYHHEIFRSNYHWRPCKRSRSKVKVTEVKTQCNRLQTVTLAWFHIWRWSDAQSDAWCGLGEMSYCFSKSSVKFKVAGDKNNRLWNDAQSLT